jgi:xanthine dehydrogenase accessory factor
MIDTLTVLRDCLRRGEPAVLATIVQLSPAHVALEEAGEQMAVAPGAKIVVRPGVVAHGSLGDPTLDEVVIRDAIAALQAGKSQVRDYPSGVGTLSSVAVFYDVFTAPPRMVVIGATDFTAALVRVAKTLGYRVSVCDARAVFATSQRFPEADEVVVDWPDHYLATVAGDLGPLDAVCVLSHDHKFDVPALVAALTTPVGYIGAMGSHHTHGQRLDLLRSDGVDEEELSRIMGPIGIDIGARTPEETAIAIVAEIIALRTHSVVPSLRDRTGAIHQVRW